MENISSNGNSIKVAYNWNGKDLGNIKEKIKSDLVCWKVITVFRP